MENITIRFRDGSEWELDPKIIAELRARDLAYFNEPNGNLNFNEITYDEEYLIGLSDRYILIDWLKGNTNWYDIESEIQLVKQPIYLSYGDKFNINEYEAF